jgi:hypothetical protein
MTISLWGSLRLGGTQRRNHHRAPHFLRSIGSSHLDFITGRNLLPLPGMRNTRLFEAIFTPKSNILPRQARDKHTGKLSGKDVSYLGGRGIRKGEAG